MTPGHPTELSFTFRAIDDDPSHKKWHREFHQRWPAYKSWFLRGGESERPTYLESLSSLKQYMPEFVDIYEGLAELVGGGDHAARFLAQYSPPPLFRGCSQAVYIQDEPVIVRNYDYSPFLCDGLVMRTNFDTREVIAATDCMTGVLDGINQDGLALSMAFGGRKEFVEGFSITLVLRYLLEYCTNVAEAFERISGIPINGAYNIAAVDRNGEHCTIVVAPNEKTIKTDGFVSTNHQTGSNWPEYADKVKTRQRYDYLTGVVEDGNDSADSFPNHFLQPPLFQNAYARGFGTVYTAAYFPARGEARYLWPGHQWSFNFDQFAETTYEFNLHDPKGYPYKTAQYAEFATQTHVPGLSF